VVLLLIKFDKLEQVSQLLATSRSAKDILVVERQVFVVAAQIVPPNACRGDLGLEKQASQVVLARRI
jgi:hypothetical protein